MASQEQPNVVRMEDSPQVQRSAEPRCMEARLQRKGSAAEGSSVQMIGSFLGLWGELTRSKGTMPNLWSAQFFTWNFVSWDTTIKEFNQS